MRREERRRNERKAEKAAQVEAAVQAKDSGLAGQAKHHDDQVHLNNRDVNEAADAEEASDVDTYMNILKIIKK